MIKVILVEDEIHIRRGLSLFTPWQQYGCVLIGEACNAFEGEEMVEKLQPDIVIVDICMPGRTGLEMIENLQGKGKTEYIILSGHNDFEYARRAISLGVTGYLLKPTDDVEFENVLKLTIQKVEKQRRMETFERIQQIGFSHTIIADETVDFRRENQIRFRDIFIDRKSVV